MSNTTLAPYPVEVQGQQTATKPIKAKIDRLREVRTIKADAESEAKALTAEILDWAGPATKAIMWGKTKLASIVGSHSTSCNFKLLAEAYPDAYAATVSTKPYKQVR